MLKERGLPKLPGDGMPESFLHHMKLAWKAALGRLPGGFDGQKVPLF